MIIKLLLYLFVTQSRRQVSRIWDLIILGIENNTQNPYTYMARSYMYSALILALLSHNGGQLQNRRQCVTLLRDNPFLLPGKLPGREAEFCTAQDHNPHILVVLMSKQVLSFKTIAATNLQDGIVLWTATLNIVCATQVVTKLRRKIARNIA